MMFPNLGDCWITYCLANDAGNTDRSDKVQLDRQGFEHELQLIDLQNINL